MANKKKIQNYKLFSGNDAVPDWLVYALQHKSSILCREKYQEKHLETDAILSDDICVVGWDGNEEQVIDENCDTYDPLVLEPIIAGFENVPYFGALYYAFNENDSFPVITMFDQKIEYDYYYKITTINDDIIIMLRTKITQDFKSNSFCAKDLKNK